MNDLCDYEIQVLRMLAGETVQEMQWGAAMSAALGLLKGRRLVELAPTGDRSLRYQITDTGRAALAGAKNAPR